jgi:flagellar biosynthesis protein FliQ
MPSLMNEAQAWTLVLQSLQQGCILSTPILTAITLVSLVVGVSQALTQIQEQTLALFLKITVTILGIWLLGPWMLHHWVSSLTLCLTQIGQP